MINELANTIKTFKHFPLCFLDLFELFLHGLPFFFNLNQNGPEPFFHT